MFPIINSEGLRMGWEKHLLAPSSGAHTWVAERSPEKHVHYLLSKATPGDFGSSSKLAMGTPTEGSETGFG